MAFGLGRCGSGRVSVVGRRAAPLRSSANDPIAAGAAAAEGRTASQYTQVDDANERMRQDPGRRARAGDAGATVMRYHEQTKHHFFRYARSPGYLDWANQPEPFRRYRGRCARAVAAASVRRRAVLAALRRPVSRPGRGRAPRLAPAVCRACSSIRWRFRRGSRPATCAGRCARTRRAGTCIRPKAICSSTSVAGLGASPGLYHYAPREHALELRAEWPQGSVASAAAAASRRTRSCVGLTSVHWREAWKYGERAFRYCQHDVGHVLGALRIAAQTLGWRMLLLDGTSDDTVASLLGVDRADDFEAVEREHPGCLAVIWPADRADGSEPCAQSISLPLFIEPDVPHDLRPYRWHGKPSRLSRDDPVPWPIVHEVQAAAWKADTERDFVVLPRHDPPGLRRRTRAPRHQSSTMIRQAQLR